MRKIIVMGDKTDVHARRIYERVRECGHRAELLRTNFFPRFFNVSWDLDGSSPVIGFESGTEWALDEVDSLYWRNFKHVTVDKRLNSFNRFLADRNSRSLIKVLLNHPSIKCVNPYPVFEMHQMKPLQLKEAQREGLLTPKTLVSNDISKIDEFCRRTGECIVKPVYGGDYVSRVAGVDVSGNSIRTKERELNPYHMPYTVQEFVQGRNIRTFVFGEITRSFEIIAESVDFRVDENQEVRAFDPPPDLEESAVRITKKLGMYWTAIDWKLKNNRYYFLEANFSPMFYGFERATGVPLTQDLVDLLTEEWQAPETP